MSKKRKAPDCVRPNCTGKAINSGTARGLCRKHHREFTQRRRATLGPDWFVDTAPLAEHIHALRAAGVGYADVAERTGLHRDTISNICRRRQTRTTAENAAKILAVPVPAIAESSCCRLPAIGTRRRIQALCAIGYSNAYIAQRLGMTETNVSRIHRRSGHVSAEIARRVDLLFRELQLTPGSNVRARNRARKNGWPPPLAWDEETIDDPAATPASYNANSSAPFIEKYRDAREIGRTDQEIAQQLGIQPKSLARYLSRYAYEEAS